MKVGRRMNWAQLLSILGGGATSGGLLWQLLAYRRYVLKHRALTAVMNREGSTAAQWQAAAEALATIDAPTGLRRRPLPARGDGSQRRTSVEDGSPSIPNQRTR